MSRRRPTSTTSRARFENEIELPGLGTASGFGGNMDDKFIFYTFTSFTYPTSIFRYDIAARKSAMFRAPEIPGLDTNQYETKQVFVSEQGRREGADVSRPQEGAGARRQQPDVDVRLRRVQHRDDAGVQLAAHRAARAGLRLRQRQHARRQRVRRSVARRGDEDEEAERVRRLHRGGRVADRQQVHVAREARGAGRIERRAARRRRDQSAARSLPRGDPAGRA